MAEANLIALIPTPPPEPGTAWRPLTARPVTWRTSTAWRTGHDGPAVRIFAQAAEAALRTHAAMYEAAAERPRAARPETEFAL